MATDRDVERLRDNIGELYNITRSQGIEVTRLQEKMDNTRKEQDESESRMEILGMQYEEIKGQIQEIRTDYQVGVSRITTEQKEVCRVVRALKDEMESSSQDNLAGFQKVIRNPWVWAALIYVLTQGYDIAFDPASGGVSITQPTQIEIGRAHV